MKFAALLRTTAGARCDCRRPSRSAGNQLGSNLQFVVRCHTPIRYRSVCCQTLYRLQQCRQHCRWPPKSVHSMRHCGVASQSRILNDVRTCVVYADQLPHLTDVYKFYKDTKKAIKAATASGSPASGAEAQFAALLADQVFTGCVELPELFYDMFLYLRRKRAVVPRFYIAFTPGASRLLPHALRLARWLPAAAGKRIPKNTAVAEAMSTQTPTTDTSHPARHCTPPCMSRSPCRCPFAPPARCGAGMTPSWTPRSCP